MPKGLSSGPFLQAIIPARQDKTWQRELKNMAVNVMGALRGAVPLPAAKLLQLPSTQPEHATRDVSADDSATDDSAAEWHLLAHAPFAAMLAAVALAVHCLTRLSLSLVGFPLNSRIVQLINGGPVPS